MTFYDRFTYYFVYLLLDFSHPLSKVFGWNYVFCCLPPAIFDFNRYNYSDIFCHGKFLSRFCCKKFLWELSFLPFSLDYGNLKQIHKTLQQLRNLCKSLYNWRLD